MIPSDSDLIARIVAGDDREAFGELVRRHQSGVRNFLRHLTRGDAALADDLAQETFLKSYQGIRGFRGASGFKTWLFGIAFNYYRNARRGLRHTEWEGDHPEPSVGSGTRAADLGQDIASAVKKLSLDEQTAVHLFYRQGLSHPEIASITHWPIGTVKTHLARAKDKLRTLLQAWNATT